MRQRHQYPAGILVGLALAVFFPLVSMLLLSLGGCGKKTAEMARLTDALSRVRAELASNRVDHQKAQRRLRARVSRLEAELAMLKRRPTARIGRAHRGAPPPPGVEDPPRREPPVVGERPGPRVSCPSALPDAARKVRRRMRLAKLRKVLDGVKLQKTKALTLTGSGSRTRRVWTGPCFRITLEGGRVATVELDGVKDKKRRRRRRRR
jgi:hypothetical protein